jgi:hypothetical protein
MTRLLYPSLIFNGNMRRFFKYLRTYKIFFVYHTIHSLDIFNVGHPFLMIIRAPLLAKCLNKTCKR